MHVKTYSSLDQICPGAPIALCLGKFDAFHRGHRYILEKLQSLAQENSLKSALWCFYGVLPGGGFQRVNSALYRKHLLKGIGLDEIHEMKFIPSVSEMSAEQFLDEVLIKKLNVRAILLGSDARLGKNRKTGVDEFLQMAEKRGLKTMKIEQIQDCEEVISSSLIKKEIKEGNFSRVKALLGREYGLSGEVIRGKGKGRELGFPTANIALDGLVHPPVGVFGGRVSLSFESESFPALIYIGRRPSVEKDGHIFLEVHIPGLDLDLYGKNLLVTFEKLIRKEKRFDHLEGLKEQIKLDLKECR